MIDPETLKVMGKAWAIRKKIKLIDKLVKKALAKRERYEARLKRLVAKID